jgi:branched-chain amino acid transport system permease protein
MERNDAMNPAFTQRFPGIRYGLIGGVCLVILSLIGMVEAFNQREIVADVISMGQTLLLTMAAFIAGLAANRAGGGRRGLLAAAMAGLIMTVLLALLVLLSQTVNLRQVFINASPPLFQILIFQQEDLGPGIGLLLLAGLLAGTAAGLTRMVPARARRILLAGVGTVVLVGLLQDTIGPIFAEWGALADISDLLYSGNGLSISGALGLFLMVTGARAAWDLKGGAVRSRVAAMPPGSRRRLNQTALMLAILVLLTLPHILGLFLSEVLTIIGLYIMLGLGLNIIIGFSGMLDLGHVAYFAIGSYTVAILTSPELGFFAWNFWQALPVAIAMGSITGVLICTPVLKMRGDYLAITTLGFGEIIRLFVLSDFLRPWLGGAQGIGKIPKAEIAGFEFASPQQMYYLILAGCLVVGFVAWRLRDSRLGRSWMAVREDEDVAQAMGINLVSTKIKAFAVGAGFSALSGAIFATKLSSVYPHSFNVMISINILCVIIVGGVGSIPGVIVGAAALVGLPELLREFADYRLLVYGAVLVAMMLLKPEGLWPEATHQRELHAEGPEIEPAAAAGGRG